MSGVTTVVLTDKELDRLKLWAEDLADGEAGGRLHGADLALYEKLRDYRTRLDCGNCCSAGKCKVVRDPQEP